MAAQSAREDTFPKLLLRHARLNLLLPVRAQLLLLSHSGLGLLAVGLHLLPLRHSRLGLLAIRLHLLTLCHALLRLLAIGLHLLALRHAVLRLLAVRADLLTFSHAGLRLLTVGANLLTVGNPRLRLLDSLLPHLLALGLHLHAFSALRTLDGSKLPLALDPRGCELTFLSRCESASHGRGSSATAAALSLGLLLSLLIAVATRSGGRRYRDRQSGDTCGQKYPGHHNISFRTAKRSVRSTVPTLKRMGPAL